MKDERIYNKDFYLITFCLIVQSSFVIFLQRNLHVYNGKCIHDQNTLIYIYFNILYFVQELQHYRQAISILDLSNTLTQKVNTFFQLQFKSIIFCFIISITVQYFTRVLQQSRLKMHLRVQFQSFFLSPDLHTLQHVF